MLSPAVLAKGYDEVVQMIKAIAAEHNIPRVENDTLARALAREVQIGHPIKAKWFKPFAEIQAAVYRFREGAMLGVGVLVSYRTWRGSCVHTHAWTCRRAHARAQDDGDD